MTNDIAIYEHNDGVLLLGADDAMELALAEFGVSSTEVSVVSPGVLRGAAGALEGAHHVMANSGRWMKLTKESAEQMRKAAELGGKIGKEAGTVGVVRGAGGKFVHLVRFETGAAAGLFTPAAPLVLASMAAQLAAQQQADEMKSMLTEIQDAVDTTIRHNIAERLGQVEGERAVIDEAASVYNEVGEVSDVTWTKVAGSPAALHRAQSTALHDIRQQVEKLKKCERDKASTSEQIEQVREHLHVYLAVLAETSRLLEEHSILELARVRALEPGQLEHHEIGLRSARGRRREELTTRLAELQTRLTELAKPTQKEIAFHPRATKQVREQALTTGRGVHRLAKGAGLAGVPEVEASSDGWFSAAKGAAAESIDKVGDAAAEAGKMAKNTADKVADAASDLAESARTGVEHFGDNAAEVAQAARSGIAQRGAELLHQVADAADRAADAMPGNKSASREDATSE